MKMQILPWTCLIVCALAVAFIACQAEVATDTHVKASDRGEEHRGVGVEAVVHERRGAYGGSDLMKKPNKKNGASNLPALNYLGGITFTVFVLLALLV